MQGKSRPVQRTYPLRVSSAPRCLEYHSYSYFFLASCRFFYSQLSDTAVRNDRKVPPHDRHRKRRSREEMGIEERRKERGDEKGRKHGKTKVQGVRHVCIVRRPNLIATARRGERHKPTKNVGFRAEKKNLSGKQTRQSTLMTK